LEKRDKALAGPVFLSVSFAKPNPAEQIILDEKLMVQRRSGMEEYKEQ
jgi:hypothetical protein